MAATVVTVNSVTGASGTTDKAAADTITADNATADSVTSDSVTIDTATVDTASADTVTPQRYERCGPRSRHHYRHRRRHDEDSKVGKREVGCGGLDEGTA